MAINVPTMPVSIAFVTAKLPIWKRGSAPILTCKFMAANAFTWYVSLVEVAE
jgi:hypothetical protein